MSGLAWERPAPPHGWLVCQVGAISWGRAQVCEPPRSPCLMPPSIDFIRESLNSDVEVLNRSVLSASSDDGLTRCTGQRGWQASSSCFDCNCGTLVTLLWGNMDMFTLCAGDINFLQPEFRPNWWSGRERLECFWCFPTVTEHLGRSCLA